MKIAATIGTVFLVLIGAQAEQITAKRRFTPNEIASLNHHGAGAGTSGVAGITTTVLYGNPEKPGLYTIMLVVPANTRIEAHSHQDNRSATVISGTWYLGYGDRFTDKDLKALPPGSFYTEPPGQTHFAQTRNEAAVVYITGFGPTSTTYVDDASHSY